MIILTRKCFGDKKKPLPLPRIFTPDLRSGFIIAYITQRNKNICSHFRNFLRLRHCKRRCSAYIIAVPQRAGLWYN